MILDEKEWCKSAFESVLKYIYDIKRVNGMNCIHENKVRKIAEYNSLNDMVNLYKWTKYINIHYSPIPHGCMNTQQGKAKFKHFWILLDSGCSSTIVMIRLIEKINKRWRDAMAHPIG